MVGAWIPNIKDMQLALMILSFVFEEVVDGEE
jgi:hypothetical protein